MNNDDDDFDGPYSMEAAPADPDRPYWRNWQRPGCPKCSHRPPTLLTHGHPSEDFEEPDPPWQHVGCLRPIDNALFECTECHHRWRE